MSSLTKTKRRTIWRFDGLVSLGDKNNSLMDKLCAVLLAIAPILQHYRGPVNTAGITVLVALLPFMYLKLLARRPASGIWHVGAISPLIAFYLYKVFSHGTTPLQFAHAAVMIVYFLAIAGGYISVTYFVKTALVLAAMACVLLVLQYVCFYMLGFHLQLAPTSLFLPESEQWVLCVRTGLIGITGKPNGFYRPSAFFLEPSHTFIYLIPLLCILLLAPHMKSWRLKMASLLTLGLFLSTSGMGICVSAGVWMLYAGLYRGRGNAFSIRKLATPRNILLLVTILLSLPILYSNVPFFHESINRILGIDVHQRNAISGRVDSAYDLVRTLTGSDLWFGQTDNIDDIEFSLPGYFSTMYKFGIIGTLLSYVFYIRGLFKLKAQYFWLSFIVVLISFFTAHTHGTFYMLYFVVFLLDGFCGRLPRRRIAAFRRVPDLLPERA